MMNLTIILLYFLSFLLIWQFVGYPSLMAIIALKSKTKNKDYSYQPFVSVIVPTYNEEKVIEKRIKNLFELDYPKDKYENIVVDSNSTDNTQEIVRGIMKKCSASELTLRLIKEEKRKGITSAINLGKKHAKGKIILVTTANSIFDKSVVKEIVPHFNNLKIGGVGGRYCIANPGENPLTKSESFYWDLEYIMRRGESVLDSACLFHGEIYAYRKEFDMDPKMLADDLDMAIQIRHAGCKVEYEPNAIVYEMAATTPKDQTSQRKRTAIGTIACLFKYWRYFILPHNLYNLFIFPSHKTLVILFPFILLAILILYAIIWNIKIVATHFVLSAFTFGVLFGLFIHLKSKLMKNERKQSDFTISSLPKIVYYVLFNGYIILLAWKDYLLKMYSVIYEKIESTRKIKER